MLIGQITAGKITRCKLIFFLFQTMVADRDTVAVRLYILHDNEAIKKCHEQQQKN